mmetsp:Transcript_19521/g.24598  ORF Transcript_19521/g.24598 Transcript_19521/m.24598 type:complete len:84 (-) Transcript_19521:195-446(-)
MSAIFNFSSLMTVTLLSICTTAYLREMKPSIFDNGMEQVPGQPLIKRKGFSGFCWKLSRIGERLSPFISISCILMALHVLYKK